MGVSFSVEEELFFSFRWSQLLDHTMNRESSPDWDPHRSPFTLSGAAAVSFKDWHALFSVLAGDPSTFSGAASMCAEMVKAGIQSAPHCAVPFPVQCPIIPVLVYMLAFWKQQLSATHFKAYLVELEAYQEKWQAAREAALLDEESEPLIDEMPNGPAEEEDTPELQPMSRRRRLLGAIKNMKNLRHLQPRHVPQAEWKAADPQEMLNLALVLCRKGLLKESEDPREGEVKLVWLTLLDLWLAAGNSSFFRAVALLMQAVMVIVYRVPGKEEKTVFDLRTIYECLHRRDATVADDGNSGPEDMEGDKDVAHCISGCRKLLDQLYEDLLLGQLEFQASRIKEGEAMQRKLSEFRKAREASLQDSSTDVTSSDASFDARWERGRSQYVGQEHIWKALHDHFSTAGAFDSEKPTVILLFGPSGLGKSELAKRLASALHGVPENALESSGKLVHIHMPSFCTKDSIYSLVDPPAAHVGDGILLSALLRHPDSVVVLDEFEKSTTSAVQHLWLSAFQKHGTLRSLKESSRSVSTAGTTFILTCNLVGTQIQNLKENYLQAGEDERQRLRSAFVSSCREACVSLLGEPFVNRVDFFFPVMPYSVAECKQFVLLVLERLLGTQVKKGRHVAVTLETVQFLAEKLTTFHAVTVEELVKPLLHVMIQQKWTHGVLTTLMRITPQESQLVLVPVKFGVDRSSCSSRISKSSALLGFPAPDESGTEPVYWNQLKGGQTWMERCFPEAMTLSAIITEKKTCTSAAGQAVSVSAAPSSHSAEKTRSEAEPAIPKPSPASPAGERAGLTFPPSHTDSNSDLLKMTEVETVKEKLLETEVATLKELLVNKDTEIEYLKEKVLLLQKALAVILMALFISSAVMTLVLGVKVAMTFYVVLLTVLVVVLNIPLSMLWEAFVALFSFLGPVRFFFLLAVPLLILWARGSFRRCGQ